MKIYETKGRVGGDGTLKVEAPLELADQEVEVLIRQKRPPASERLAAWQRLAQRVRSLPDVQQITDQDIEREIDAVRSGR